MTPGPTIKTELRNSSIDGKIRKQKDLNRATELMSGCKKCNDNFLLTLDVIRRALLSLYYLRLVEKIITAVKSPLPLTLERGKG